MACTLARVISFSCLQRICQIMTMNIRNGFSLCNTQSQRNRLGNVEWGKGNIMKMNVKVTVLWPKLVSSTELWIDPRLGGCEGHPTILPTTSMFDIAGRGKCPCVDRVVRFGKVGLLCQVNVHFCPFSIYKYIVSSLSLSELLHFHSFFLCCKCEIPLVRERVDHAYYEL